MRMVRFRIKRKRPVFALHERQQPQQPRQPRSQPLSKLKQALSKRQTQPTGEKRVISAKTAVVYNPVDAGKIEPDDCEHSSALTKSSFHGHDYTRVGDMRTVSGETSAKRAAVLPAYRRPSIEGNSMLPRSMKPTVPCDASDFGGEIVGPQKSDSTEYNTINASGRRPVVGKPTVAVGVPKAAAPRLTPSQSGTTGKISQSCSKGYEYIGLAGSPRQRARQQHGSYAMSGLRRWQLDVVVPNRPKPRRRRSSAERVAYRWAITERDAWEIMKAVDEQQTPPMGSSKKAL